MGVWRGKGGGCGTRWEGWGRWRGSHVPVVAARGGQRVFEGGRGAGRAEGRRVLPDWRSRGEQGARTGCGTAGTSAHSSSLSGL